MLSLTKDRFDEPEFAKLSANGQAFLRAQWKWMEALVAEGVDLSASGLPGPEYDAPAVVAAKDEWDAIRERMSEDEIQQYSAYAHRCDYPEIHDIEGRDAD